MLTKTRNAVLLLFALVALSLSASIHVAGQGFDPLNPSPKNPASSVLSVVENKESDSSPQDQAISICSQHAPKCPLTAAGWPGEPDGWQYTGKKWLWVPGTKNVFNRTAVWEYSQPYSGSTPAYFGQREDHYASCTGDPQDCSFFSGTPPMSYDWERWLQVGDNYKVMQLGNLSEEESYLIGDVDCSSGIFYPVVDHSTPYYYTPMYTNRWGECTGGGYVAAYLHEQWGEPLSAKRAMLCDNPTNGVPADLSPAGNTVCKISPYVGVVFQRYIFGAGTPADLPSVGCEAVLYAWGWSEPRAPASGQQYQTWFRNGELRFTRWYDLSNQVSLGDIPEPDDHNWWNARCQGAWEVEGNWLYSGTFRVGDAEYQDQASLPVSFVNQIPPSGGQVYLNDVGAILSFPNGTFTETVQVVHYLPNQAELPPTGGRFKIAPAFYLFAETLEDYTITEPSTPFTVTLQYTDEQAGLQEGSLAFYAWDGYQWQREPSSGVDAESNSLTATPDHFSLWAVMVDGLRLYLPLVELE